MEREKLIGIVEALIFASEKPLRIDDIKRVLPEAQHKEIRDAIDDLKKIYDEGSGGIFIAEVARGFQFRTRPEFAPFVKEMLDSRPKKLSRAAMETLSIIAYRQPIIRSDIERIRGVDCGGVVKVLLDRKLIKILGKRDVIGKPIIYGTTQEFLETFGLKDLKSLPTLKETGDLFTEGEIEEQKEFLFPDEEDQT
ncbi:MAG: SMC-Scp complex subunit ScpB [Deltaproteobacteria bacterium]|uniref:SMC-Scp complex subunit ScpB n=1 Tax=Candidatus Zymogenus saltonus TaxID=2844893 RepID=A0A9D8PPP1_9DELT|nr:SMC-Scp complex subunit ScpB [Candidatus Zymogenus saltonus]